jgi:DNA mismatch repair protein MutL
LNQREVHEFVRHYAKETLSQFQTASADLAQAMKVDEGKKFNYQPQPKYQEQFNCIVQCKPEQQDNQMVVSFD